MQFLGNFKGKPPILSKFWAWSREGLGREEGSTHGSSWPARTSRTVVVHVPGPAAPSPVTSSISTWCRSHPRSSLLAHPVCHQSRGTASPSRGLSSSHPDQAGARWLLVQTLKRNTNAPCEWRRAVKNQWPSSGDARATARWRLHDFFFRQSAAVVQDDLVESCTCCRCCRAGTPPPFNWAGVTPAGENQSPA